MKISKKHILYALGLIVILVLPIAMNQALGIDYAVRHGPRSWRIPALRTIEIELRDPVLKRTLKHAHAVSTLAIAD